MSLTYIDILNIIFPRLPFEDKEDANVFLKSAMYMFYHENKERNKICVGVHRNLLTDKALPINKKVQRYKSDNPFKI